jgi:NAD-dependent oxidoreductase involved in siderophore biosynthesis
MTTSSPWPKMLPSLGILLAIALLAAAGSVWWSGSGTITVNDGGLGELIAVTQAARTEANGAITSAAASSFDSVAESRAAITRLRASVAANEAASADARRLASDAALWQRIERNLASVVESRDSISRRSCLWPPAIS